MITIVAEKYDVAARICTVLDPINYKGKKLSVQDINKYKSDKEFTRFISKNGYLTAHYNNEEYAITWTQGHMAMLYQFYDYNPSYSNWHNIPYPFFPDEYHIKIKDEIDFKTGKKTGNPSPWATRQLSIIKNLVNQSKYIISATDDDREGELIFLYVYDLLGTNKEFKKMVLDSQTEDGIKKSFNNIYYDDAIMRKSLAGKARNIGDLDVGANISGFMTIKFGGNGTDNLLTYGRVQTVALNELVRNENEILNFVSKPFWYLIGTFTTNSGESYIGKHSVKQYFDKKECDSILNKIQNKKGIVTKNESTDVQKDIPLLYNTDTIIVDSNKKYGYSSKKVLDILESLYMNGYITYPRTSSKCLTTDMKDDVVKILNNIKNNNNEYANILSNADYPNNFTKRHFDTSKVESHFAIIPTTEYPTNISTEESNVYHLIVKSLIRIAFKKAIVQNSVIETTIENEVFKTTGTIIKDPQWLIVDKLKDDTILPNINVNDIVDASCTQKQGKTEPPSRYTDASLTTFLATASRKIDDADLKETLENRSKGGIGTGATRPGIIEMVIRKYATRKGKYIIPTEKGMKVIKLLPIEDLKSAEMTAKWEKRLYDIENGSDTLENFLNDLHITIANWCEQIKNAEVNEVVSEKEMSKYICPKCGKPLQKFNWGYSCSGYKKDSDDSCNFAISFNQYGVTIGENEVNDLLKKGRTKFIKGFKKKDNSGTYNAFLILSDEFRVIPSFNVGIDCPLCGSPITITKFGWGCSNWKNGCKVSIPNELSGAKISDKEKEKYLTKRETGIIKGFVRKSDNEKYDAILILNDNGQLNFKKPDNSNKKNKK